MARRNAGFLRLHVQKETANLKELKDFISRLNSSVDFDKRYVRVKKNRYFLITRQIEELTKDFFYAGTYLGKTKKGLFFPSFPLLVMIAERNANKVIIDRRTEWLFVCGRDVFRKGILRVAGSTRKGDSTLVLNEHNECLGFGRITRDLNGNKEIGRASCRERVYENV
jgi:ribosome biogenesis protein Nip4